MKEQILEALQTRFAGVDAKTLGRIAAKLAKTTESEEQIQTAVDGVTFQQVLENYGDARATDATKTAVANYEKLYGLKDGVKTEQQTAQQPAETDAALKALEDKLNAMEKQLQGYQAKELGNVRQAKLDAMLKGAPEAIANMYKGNFAAMTFESDEAFSGWIETNTPIVQQLTNDMNAKGAVVHQPKGGAKERPAGDADPLVVARAERVAAKAEAAPSVIMGGLPTTKV